MVMGARTSLATAGPLHRQRNQGRVQRIGHALGVAHHRLRRRIGADQRQHAFAGWPWAFDGASAHVAGDVGIHALGRTAQGQFAQGGQIALAEEAVDRPARHVGAIDAALRQPCAQLRRRQVDQLDLIGEVQSRDRARSRVHGRR